MIKRLLLLALLGLCGGPMMGSAAAQIAFVAGATASNVTGAGTTLNITLDCGSAADRLLAVGVSIASGTINAPSGITYNAVALTSRGGLTGQTFYRSEIWTLTNPAAGSNTVTITTPGVNQRIFGGAACYSGVDPTTPVGTLVSATGSSTAPSVVVTSATNDLVIDNLTSHNNSSPPPSVVAGQTLRYQTIDSGSTDGISGSTKAGAASVTMSWTLSVSGQWTIVALPLKPASAAAAVPKRRPLFLE